MFVGEWLLMGGFDLPLFLLLTTLFFKKKGEKMRNKSFLLLPIILPFYIIGWLLK